MSPATQHAITHELRELRRLQKEAKEAERHSIFTIENKQRLLLDPIAEYRIDYFNSFRHTHAMDVRQRATDHRKRLLALQVRAAEERRVAGVTMEQIEADRIERARQMRRERQ